MNERERETILAMCEVNMKVTAAAKVLWLTQRAVVAREDKITRKYGLDPRKYYDLKKLEEMARAEA